MIFPGTGKGLQKGSVFDGTGNVLKTMYSDSTSWVRCGLKKIIILIAFPGTKCPMQDNFVRYWIR